MNTQIENYIKNMKYGELAPGAAKTVRSIIEQYRTTGFITGPQTATLKSCCIYSNNAWKPGSTSWHPTKRLSGYVR